MWRHEEVRTQIFNLRKLNVKLWKCYTLEKVKNNVILNSHSLLCTFFIYRCKFIFWIELSVVFFFFARNKTLCLIQLVFLLHKNLIQTQNFCPCHVLRHQHASFSRETKINRLNCQTVRWLHVKFAPYKSATPACLYARGKCATRTTYRSRSSTLQRIFNVSKFWTRFSEVFCENY